MDVLSTLFIFTFIEWANSWSPNKSLHCDAHPEQVLLFFSLRPLTAYRASLFRWGPCTCTRNVAPLPRARPALRVCSLNCIDIVCIRKIGVHSLQVTQVRALVVYTRGKLAHISWLLNLQCYSWPLNGGRARLMARARGGFTPCNLVANRQGWGRGCVNVSES